MKHSNYVKLRKMPRRPDGATMALVASLALFFTALGVAFFYIAESMIGSKQLVNDIDANTLASTRAIAAVCLTKAQYTHTDAGGNLDTIPQQFKLCAFDSNGIPATYIDINGNPANASGTIAVPYYTEASYNEACGYTLMTCLNAASDGAAAEFASTITLIGYLHNFSNALSLDIALAATPGSANPLITNAFTTMAGNNWANIMPINTIFGDSLFGSQSTIMKPNSLRLGCLTTAQQASNVYLPVSYTAQFADNATINNWLNNSALSQVTSTAASANGAKLVTGGVPLDLSKLNPAFAGQSVELVSFDVGQVTHSIASTGNPQAFDACASILNPAGAFTAPAFPYNALQVTGETEQPKAPAANKLSLSVLSSALTSTAQMQIMAPHGYIRIMNGPDFVTAMNNGGHSAATEQNILSGLDPNSKSTARFFSNVELEPHGPGSTTDLSYNGAATMFNIFSFENTSGDGRDWVVIGTDHDTGVWKDYQGYLGGGTSDAAKLAAWGRAALDAPPKGIPATNYNTNGADGVDDLYLVNNSGGNPKNKGDTNPPSMPFNWDTDKLYGSTQTNPIDTVDSFSAWINYNRSYKPGAIPGKHGYDGLKKLAALDPASSIGGSPYLFNNFPHYEVKGTGVSTLRATSASNPLQHMTISDALLIQDILIISDSAYILTTDHPQWVDAILPVVAANYGIFYLAPQAGGTKTSLNAIEYAKSQIITLYSGLGMTVLPGNPEGLTPHPGEANGDVLPTHPGAVYLPMAEVTGPASVLNPGVTICSGLKDFVGPPSTGFAAWPPGSPTTNPYGGSADGTIKGNNQNLLVHKTWTNPGTIASFAQLATPIQLMYGVNILANNGTFNAFDGNFPTIMNGLLKAVQRMNPNANYQMQDVVNALNSQTVDLLPAPGAPANPTPTGTILYLSFNSNTNQLQVSTTPPPGDALTPATGTPIQYWTTYVVSGGANIDNSHDHEAEPDALKTLVDTADGGVPNGPKYNGFPGWNPKLEPAGIVTGDAAVHEVPFRSLAALGSVTKANPNGNYIYAEDMLQWTPSAGAGLGSTNFGDLQLYESVGPSMQFSSIN